MSAFRAPRAAIRAAARACCLFLLRSLTRLGRSFCQSIHKAELSKKEHDHTKADLPSSCRGLFRRTCKAAPQLGSSKLRWNPSAYQPARTGINTHSSFVHPSIDESLYSKLRAELPMSKLRMVLERRLTRRDAGSPQCICAHSL